MRLLEARVILSAAEPGERGRVYSSAGLAVHREGDREVLVCAYRAGTSKVGRDGRIELLESRDGGGTWQRIPSPLDADHAGALAPSGGQYQLAGSHIAASSDGTLVLAAARMLLAEPGDARYDPQAAGIVDAECVMVRRDAQGWGEPVVFDGRRTADEWAIPCGSPVALGGGRWFAPAERHAKTHVPQWLRGYDAFDLLSSDDGRTWALGGAMLNDPDREVVYYDQHVTRLADGRLLSLAWVHDVIADRTLPARAGWSEDDGATWSRPQVTTVEGGPAAPVHLGNDRVLAAYPHREAPAGIRVCVSPDGGRTWDPDSEFVVWDDATRSFAGRRPARAASATAADPLWDTMWGWSFGLPTPALLADGSVGVVFYAADEAGTPQVCFARLGVDG